MRPQVFYIPLVIIIILVLFNMSEALNFYTGEESPSTSSDVIFNQLLSGNDLFETVYGTFNNTGLLLLGGALLLGSGKIIKIHKGKTCHIFIFKLEYCERRIVFLSE